MGKVTGFMEYERLEEGYAPVSVRLKNYSEFVIGLPESQAKVHSLPREQVIRDVLLAAQPSKRFVEVEEVAALAVYLCSDNARSITGAAIPIDGGWTAR